MKLLIVYIFFPISFYTCFGGSKEPSQWDGSFEYPQHIFWLRNKKISFLFCTLNERPEDGYGKCSKISDNILFVFSNKMLVFRTGSLTQNSPQNSKQKKQSDLGLHCLSIDSMLFWQASCLFVWFDSLCPINNLSVKQGWVFLGWTSTKLG